MRAGSAHAERAGRREFLRASLRRDANGGLAATRFPREGTGILTSLTESDGLAAVAEDVAAVAEGDRIDFYPHALLW